MSGGKSKSTSQKNPVSASSAVFKILFRNVSDQMLCDVAEHELVRNVAEHVSETVRNVPGQVPDVGEVKTRPRNVSDSGSVVPDVGRQGALLTDVGGQFSNLMSLYGRGWTIAQPYKLLAST